MANTFRPGRIAAPVDTFVEMIRILLGEPCTAPRPLPGTVYRVPELAGSGAIARKCEETSAHVARAE